MLKTILSISGKPGLYKLISQSKNMIIVESLIDGKRIPSHSHDKVVALSDIAMFTDAGEVPLHEVFEKMRTKENGQPATIDPKGTPDTLRAYFGEVLPDFDRDRVYPTDIKKLILWYNLLTKNGITDFSVKEETESETKSVK